MRRTETLLNKIKYNLAQCDKINITCTVACEDYRRSLSTASRYLSLYRMRYYNTTKTTADEDLDYEEYLADYSQKSYYLHTQEWRWL